MKLWLFLAMVPFAVSCVQKRGVNEVIVNPPILPSGGADPAANSQSFNNYMGRAPIAAISGTLYLNGELPTPLARISIALFKKENGQWKEIARTSTETGGTFSFTRAMLEGDYDLQVMDSRYLGHLPVTLTSAPQQNLILMVERVKK
jgi:5-hydroxyisourate hydrolase-like protein (transthyretin family)